MYKQMTFLLIILFCHKSKSEAVVRVFIGDTKIPNDLINKLKACTSTNENDCKLMFKIKIVINNDDLYEGTKYYNTNEIIDTYQTNMKEKPNYVKISIAVYGPRINEDRKKLGLLNEKVYLPKLDTVFYSVTADDFVVYFKSKVDVKCQDHYYGKNCASYCKPIFNNLKCNHATGEKICLLQCDKRYTCVFKEALFVCDCNDEWYGEGCAFNKKAYPPKNSNTTLVTTFTVRNTTYISIFVNKGVLSLTTIIIICISVLFICSIIVVVVLVKKLGKRKEKPLVSIPLSVDTNFETHNLFNENPSINRRFSNKSSPSVDGNGYLLMNSLKNDDSLRSVRKLPSIPMKIEDNESVYEQPLEMDDDENHYTSETYMTVDDEKSVENQNVCDDYQYELPKTLY